MTHCSNITGTFNPIKEIAEIVHAANPRAEIVVDGVAYAPHRIPDVKDLGVDYYGFSYYKVHHPAKVADRTFAGVWTSYLCFVYSEKGTGQPLQSSTLFPELDFTGTVETSPWRPEL